MSQSPDLQPRGGEPALAAAGHEARLAALGLTLPPAASPVANYVPVVISDGLATVSGQLPRGPGGLVSGKICEALSVEAGREAARLCALAVLAQLREALGGSLDRVERCVQLTGFVNAPADFTEHPQVINGASDLMVEVFGEAGRHARAAVGVGSLPLGAAVEVAAIFAVRS